MSSSRSDAATFLGLPAKERLLFVQASALLPLVVVSLDRSGYERTRRRLGRLSRPGRPTPHDVDDQIESSVRMVHAAISRSPVPSACLARSMTLWLLLRRRGIDSEIVFGVRAGGEPLDAHAWLERDGRPVNETQATVDSYARLEPGTSA